MECTQRLYLTKDKKKLVGDGHKDAATLYAVPGDEIPQSAVDRFGLIDGHLKGFDPAKEREPAPNKEKKGGQDKGGGNPSPPTGDDLAALKGVGAKTAEALGKAGYISFAAIAELDPASPPAVEGLPAVFKWADVIADAKGKAPAA